jgi:hypothetical protein
MAETDEGRNGEPDTPPDRSGIAFDPTTADDGVEHHRLEAADRLECDSRAEREVHDSRDRHDVNLADAELAETLRRALAADVARADLRFEATGERGLARTDTSRAAALLAGTAGRDDPAAEADRTAADRARSSANLEDRLANYDDAAADSYGAEAADLAAEASRPGSPEPQPPAVEAVRNLPPHAPKARRNARPRLRQKKQFRDHSLGD